MLLRVSLLLCLAAAGASAGELAVSGYFKNLWQYSRSVPDNRPYYLDTSRARLTLDGSLSAAKAHVDYDQEALAGSFFKTAAYRSFGLSDPPAWLTMEQTISTNTTALWRHRLYRGWLGVETEDGLVARFGRQRIAWGTGKIFNPTDVLNPFSPLSVERDERRGVDAFYLRRGLGALSQSEAAYAPQDNWPQSALLLRLKTNLSNYDFSAMGGKIASSSNSFMLGGDFAGNWLDGTLRGEWSYSAPKTRSPFWKACLGYDYAFGGDTRLPGLKDAAASIEFFHNGAGATRRLAYNYGALFSGREIVVARDYLGLILSKDLHPLLKLDLTALANLNDSSHFLGPSLQWNAVNNLFLTAGWQRFGGTRLSEYGRLPNIAYLQGQYFF